jgi:carbamoyl-phosphate synthase large subunit
VSEGRPHTLDRIKNSEYSYIVNTTEGRVAIEDSRQLRRAALRYKVNYTTTLNGALATCQAHTADPTADEATVNSVQELHKRIVS